MQIGQVYELSVLSEIVQIEGLYFWLKILSPDSARWGKNLIDRKSHYVQLGHANIPLIVFFAWHN